MRTVSCAGMLETLSEANISAAICGQQELLEQASVTQMVEHGTREGSKRVGISEFANSKCKPKSREDKLDAELIVGTDVNTSTATPWL